MNATNEARGADAMPCEERKTPSSKSPRNAGASGLATDATQGYFEVPDEMTDSGGARPVVRRAPHREVGIVNAPWLLTHGVHHESHLERRFIMVALACPVVVDITHQPMTVQLTTGDGSLHRYTPDFQVQLADGTILVVEVKPHAFLEKTAGLRAAAKAYFEAHGALYLTITDKQIDHNGRSARAILLMRFGRLGLSQEQAEECKRLLDVEMAGNASVSALVDRGVSEAAIWHLVAKHALRTNVALNMGAEEIIVINDSTEDCHVQFERWFGTADR